jgi:tetratricopeptide (TPR) repeat protein
VELDRYDVFSLDLLARLSYNNGDYAAAASYGARAAHAYPPRSESYEAPVLADIALGQWADAERLLVTALGHVQTPHLHVLLGRVYLATGRAALAAGEVSAALGLDPGNAEALQLQAQLKN